MSLISVAKVIRVAIATFSEMTRGASRIDFGRSTLFILSLLYPTIRLIHLHTTESYATLTI